VTQFHPADLAAIFLYLIGVFLVAFWSRRANLDFSQSPEKIAEGQYLAGRNLSLTESIGSIIATEVSALTFLGLPAFAFQTNFSFILVYVGAIVGRFIIARWMVPAFYNKGITVYSIIKNESVTVGRENGQKVLAGIYTVSKILAVGVRFYSGSIIVSEFFQLSVLSSLSIIMLLTFFYTLFGGLKAVVRTDLLQALVFIAGGLCAYVIIPQIDGRSLSELWQAANLAGHTDWWPKAAWGSLLTGVFGGIIFDMATHGVDQDFTQRLMAARSLKTAQRSIFFSSFCSIAVGLLFLGVGALLWSHYQVHALPAGIVPDRIFAYFIANHFPPFFKGLMLAGAMAATMSTLDSTINAISSVFWNDFFPHRTHLNIKYYLLIDNLVVSIGLLAVAYLSSFSEGLLLLGLKIASWSGGCLLGTFLAVVLFKLKTPALFNGRSVMLAYAFNLLLVWFNSNVLEWSWQWNVYWGTGGTMIVLFSLGKLMAQPHLDLAQGHRPKKTDRR
jgi:SSS family solute:Na+ symporter